MIGDERSTSLTVKKMEKSAAVYMHARLRTVSISETGHSRDRRWCSRLPCKTIQVDWEGRGDGY
jgi:hypothetical protein